MEDLLHILSVMAAKRSDMEDSTELFLDMGDRVVKTVAAQCGAKSDEVAILWLTSDGKHLRFVAPKKFVQLGTIPLTKRDSIAVAVFAKKVAEANNNVPLVKHVSFFESVKLRDRPLPIQKMITVPILHRGQAVGVAQVSRKGETGAQAGPDFTTPDVEKVQGIFEAVAAYFAQACPSRF
ncbi:MAG TPA: GAF domain-containing protein [Vicinamibacteria bacterium]|nr:GAF domain-containing protein [Vicinamibacteria bacterium]